MSGEKEESLWWNLLCHPKLLLMVFASPCVAYIGASDLYSELSERSPTHFQAEQIADEYRGQRWLTVDGRLLPEYAFSRPSDNGFVNVDVPLVPLDWKQGQIVQVVGSFSMQGSKIASWKAKTASSPQYTLTGSVGPFGPMRRWDIFPTLRFQEPVVYINDGHSPDSAIMSLFILAVGGFFLVCSWMWFAALLVSWRDQRQAAAAERENAERAMWS